MILALACAAPIEHGGAGEPLARAVSPAPSSTGPTPPLVFDVGPLAPGIDVSVVARNVWPGENVYLTWSTAGPGRTCPSELAGACLDLAEPAPWAGPWPADQSTTSAGVVRWAIDAGPVWLQAVVFRHDGVVDVGPVVVRPVYRPDEVHVGDGPPPPGARAITGDWVVDPAAPTIEAPGLEQIGGDWVVWSSAATSLAVPDLEVVGGTVSLYDTPGLASVDAPELHTIGGSLSVNRMDGVVDLRGLGALRAIGGDLYVFHDVNLVSLAGLERLARVGAGIQLWEDYALAEVHLPALHTVGGKLDLFDDDALTAMHLPALRTLGAYELHHCDAMTGVGRFPALTWLPGELTLQYDDALSSLAGLSALERLGAASIRFDGALDSFAGLGSLAVVDGTFELIGAHALPAVDLPALTTAGAVTVSNNAGLVSPGLDALHTVTGALSFVDNPTLSQCAIEALVDRIEVGAVVCGDNLDDGCATWCAPGDTGP